MSEFSLFIIIMGVMALVAAAFVFDIFDLDLWKMIKRKAVEKPETCPEAPIVEMVALLLREKPEQWTPTAHRLEHRLTGASIWTANALYGLALSLDGEAWPESTSRGGVPLHDATKQILWEAVQWHHLWQATQKAHDFGAKVKRAMGQ